MLLDLDRYVKDAIDYIAIWFGINDPAKEKIFGKTFRKVYYFVGYSMIPFILQITSFIILIWIFNRIQDKYGVERLLSVLGAILAMSLRGKS